MEAAPGKYSHLRQRDVSVPMLRVKMSRRRSQSQKENRERAINSRRQLDQVPEMDSTLEASIMAVNISNVKETAPHGGQSSKASARLEMLKKWKENKSLQKEKEKREKERKGVFKVGLFRPTDSFSLQVPVTKPREAVVNVPQSRGTRLTKLDQQPKEPVVGRMTRSRTALVPPQPAPTTTRAKPVQPAVHSARAKVQPAATRGKAVPKAEPVACAVIGSNMDKPAGGRTTRGNAKPVATSTGRGKNKVPDKTVATVVETTPVVSEKPAAESTCREEEAESVVGSDTLASATEGTSSFAPKGFVFETPAGLSTFKFDPLTPRSADGFLRPSLNFPPVPPFEAEKTGPSPPKSPHRSPQAPASPQEPQYDVPYFRSQVTTETTRLTSLCQFWEVKVDDLSIPEEMRDRMRTAVGQARLLMKERFGQFLGLVDDCEFGRGEKPTVPTDLQGFWEMVYFQVEDVSRKFDALKEAEAKNWVEEDKPAPRRRKIIKKPPPTAASKGAGTNAEAKSRLAAIKAAMKAKQQAAAAEKAAQAGTEDNPNIEVSEAPAVTQATDTVVFNGGFFQVESPARMGSLSRLSTAKLPQTLSPCGRVTRQSIAMSHLSPDHRNRTPARRALALAHTPCTESEQSPAYTESELAPGTEAANIPETPESTCPVQDGEGKSEIVSQPLSPRLSPAPCIPTTSSSQTLSPRLSPAPCIPTSPSSQSVEPELSFTVSPCVVVPPKPTVATADENYSPDCSVVEDGPGLDMAKYFQPSDGCSPSINSDVMETSLQVDVEMESPIARHEDERTQEDATMPPTDLDQLLPLQLPQPVFEGQNAESDLLLFTPNLKDRIRQSVCPSDLMVFTPPN